MFTGAPETDRVEAGKTLDQTLAGEKCSERNSLRYPGAPGRSPARSAGLPGRRFRLARAALGAGEL